MTDQPSTTTSPPPSSSSPARRRRAPAPGFRTPGPPPPQAVPTPQQIEGESASARPFDSAPPLEQPLPELPPELDEAKPAPAPSSPASSTDRKAIEAAVAAAVSGASQLANTSLTDDEQEHAGLYLVDEQDEQGIAKPVSRLIARHATPGMLSPDLSDVVAAAVAVAVYASKQLGLLRELKRARAAGLLPTDHTPAEDAA